MSKTRPVFGKIRIKRDLFLQLLFVTLAFVLMVVSSSLYVRSMLQNHLSKQAEDILTLTKHEIESELFEPQTALLVISKTIQSIILDTNSVEMVQSYINDVGAEMQNKAAGFQLEGIFGYFEVFGGVFLHSYEFRDEEAVAPIESTWYKAAVEAGGKIAVRLAIMNQNSKDYLITFSCLIADDEGRPFGVMCLEVPLDRIRDYVVNMHIAEGGYGVLFGNMIEVIAHPSNEFIGMPARLISPGFSIIAHELELGNDLFEHEFENYVNQWSVTFTMRLDNGWVLTLMTPKAEYYRELNNMLLILCILGAILAATLSLVIIRIDVAKSKSDDLIHHKDILLAEMEKTREADERTKQMLNATPLGCKLWDRKLNVVECNQEALNLFDITDKQEFLDRFFEFSPEYQPGGRLTKDIAAEKVNQAFDEGYCRFEWMHRKLDGELIPAEITLVRVMLKGEYAVAGYIRDLREYKQMMGKIEQIDNLLNVMNRVAILLLATEDVDNMMAPIIKGMELMGRAVDLDRVQIWQNEMIDGSLHFVHKYEWVSEIGKQKEPVPIGLKYPYSEKPEWERKFSHGEYINGPLSELPESDRDLLDPFEIKSIVIIPLFLQDYFWGFFSLDDCLKERTFSEEEINILRSGGLLIANAFLRNDMMRNIRSTAAQLEAALKDAQDANAAKSKFLATISHEIRTPMNVILGVTESQLLSEEHSKETKGEFEKIFDSGNLLLHIINDILDLSKIEAGKFDLNPANYEVLSLINDAANVNIMRFGHKQIKFRLEVDENIPLHLFGDVLRIKQILNNLLSNAFKYTDEGEIVLSFSVEKKPDGVQEDSESRTAVLVFHVSDTGPGMTQDQINKLFDEYTRFNLEANRTTVGTGLGMAITRNLVKMMGGTIEVKSAAGMGTTFTVRVPQGISGSSLLGREAAENLQKFNFSNMERERHLNISRELMPYGKVLVVDDLKSNLDVAKLLLNPYKLQIDTAESGFETIDKIKNGNVYDIVFLDHMMPKMDGMETAKHLREAGYHDPIIALTANAVAGQQEIFLANGFDGFISKPIDLRQLNDTLNKFIRDKERKRLKELGLSSAPQFDTPKTAELDVNPVISIPGVDTETGLALYGGDTKIYLSILRAYVPTALTLIEKMSVVSAETLNDYTINVHGLKGVSAGIGAKRVQEAAYNLEMTSKSGDLAGVLAGNNALLEDTKNLVYSIQAWLAGQDNNKSKPLLPRPDKTLLSHLRKCCEAYDINGVDNILDEIEKADYSSDALLVTWLRERINESDFSSVVSRLLSFEEESE